jgi:hypothetical protein
LPIGLDDRSGNVNGRISQREWLSGVEKLAEEYQPRAGSRGDDVGDAFIWRSLL